MDRDQRSQLLAEYFKVAEFVQAYDPHCLTIKAWGVSITAVALGIGLSKDVIERGYQIEVFLVALGLAISFWLTETRFKLFQLRHIPRYSALEKAIQDDVYIKSPAILESFGTGVRLEHARRLPVAFWPHVMFPHVIFVGLSLFLIFVAGINAISPRS